MPIDESTAANALNHGRLVVFPTETVFGLGASIEFPNSCSQIFQLKKRPLEDPLILHMNLETHFLEDYGVVPNNKWFEKVFKKYTPGPITFVLKKTNKVPFIVSGGLDTVALRIPQHPQAQKMLSMVRRPVAAPSANLFGKTSPTKYEHLPKYEDVLILKGLEPNLGLESTILDCTGSLPKILRHGFITKEELESFLGLEVEDATRISSILAPGMLENHYAPQRKKMYLAKNDKEFLDHGQDREVGLINLERLSISCDLIEAAANLYELIHELDEDPTLKYIVALKVPDEGIGRAINDKLIKASSKEN